MFNRNWYTVVSSSCIGSGISEGRSSNKIFNMRALDGSKIQDQSFSSSSYNFYPGISYWYPERLSVMPKVSKSSWYNDKSSRTSTVSPPYGVVFGNGTEPESIDSYTMSGDVLTTYTATYTRELVYTEEYTEIKYNYTITNTGDADFTISEVGLLGFGCLDYNSISSSYNHYYYYYNLLFERTLLESPITIPAGGVGQVTYTLRMNMPT